MPMSMAGHCCLARHLWPATSIAGAVWRESIGLTVVTVNFRGAGRAARSAAEALPKRPRRH